MKLDGKVAIVTGAASGLGRGIACCLAEEGADVVIADIDMENARKVAKEVRAFGRKALVIEADVTRQDKARQVVDDCLKTFGKVDILVNNVGGGRPQAAGAESPPSQGMPQLADVPEQFWNDSYEVNLKSQVLMTQAVVPHMRAHKSGKIINISSIAGKSINAGAGRSGESGAMMMPYGAMKAGVLQFTRSLARELGRDNINVNCICPGLIYTPSWQRSAEYRWQHVAAYKELKSPRDVFLLTVEALTPLGREQTPEDIGRMAVFFASDDAKNITGQSINVDGGIVMD